jgi:POT family proton-dependent oligopeptide transporter
MGIGYILLAVPGMTFFYISLLLIIIGNGFFKPNISTLLGYVYNKPQYRSLKDSGYNIFYMGINIGAFICNFFAAYLRNNFGWGYAFAAAGVGMFIWRNYFQDWCKALPRFRHHKTDPARRYAVEPHLQHRISSSTFSGGRRMDHSRKSSSDLILPMLSFLPVYRLLVILFHSTSALPEMIKDPSVRCSPSLPWWQFFWAVFKQNGTALTTWAENYTNRALPQAIVEPVSSINLSQVISATQR